jgi:hypothetical protein
MPRRRIIGDLAQVDKVLHALDIPGGEDGENRRSARGAR